MTSKAAQEIEKEPLINFHWPYYSKDFKSWKEQPELYVMFKSNTKSRILSERSWFHHAWVYASGRRCRMEHLLCTGMCDIVPAATSVCVSTPCGVWGDTLWYQDISSISAVCGHRWSQPCTVSKVLQSRFMYGCPWVPFHFRVTESFGMEKTSEPLKSSC